MHADYDQIKQENNRLQQQSDNQPCPHSDYEQIQSELADAKKHVCSDNSCSPEYQAKIEQKKEKEVITKINNQLKLGLQELELKELLTTLIKLIDKPPVEIEKKVIEQSVGSPLHNQNLKEVKKLNLHSLDKVLKINCGQAIKRQIEKANNYQTIIQVKEQLIKTKLTEQQDNQRTLHQQIKQQRIILLIFFLASLATIISLLIKINNKPNKKFLVGKKG